MEVNQRNIKVWSTIGPRATLGIAALDLAKKITNLMVLTCDVSTSAGLDRYRKLYPEKYIDLGIAEQNMLGVAAGLASENFNVVTTTFAPFQTLRCCEQIKVNLGYMNSKVCMVGIASGLVLGTLGFTHCCIEDVGILRSVPRITIISPADSKELKVLLPQVLKVKKPVYFRIGKKKEKTIYKNKCKSVLGEPSILQKGKKICIFGTGNILVNAIEASKKVENKIKPQIINIHTVKPFNEKKIIKYLKIFKKILILEEHVDRGGLSDLIMKTSAKFKLKNIFINHNAGNNFLIGVGDNKNARKILKLDSSSIAKSIIKLDKM